MTFTSSRRRKRTTSGPPRLPLGGPRHLEKDHAYLLKGDVFTEDLIAVWIEYKRKREDDMIRLRPHPYEFPLYYDILAGRSL